MKFGPLWCQQENTWIKFETESGRLSKVERAVHNKWESVQLEAWPKFWTVQTQDSEPRLETYATGTNGELYSTTWRQIRTGLVVTMLTTSDVQITTARSPFKHLSNDDKYEVIEEKKPDIAIIAADQLPPIPLTLEEQQKLDAQIREAFQQEQNEKLATLKQDQSLSSLPDTLDILPPLEKEALQGQARTIFDAFPLSDVYDPVLIETTLLNYQEALENPDNPVFKQIISLSSSTDLFRDLQLSEADTKTLMIQVHAYLTGLIRNKRQALANAFDLPLLPLSEPVFSLLKRKPLPQRPVASSNNTDAVLPAADADMARVLEASRREHEQSLPPFVDTRPLVADASNASSDGFSATQIEEALAASQQIEQPFGQVSGSSFAASSNYTGPVPMSFAEQMALTLAASQSAQNPYDLLRSTLVLGPDTFSEFSDEFVLPADEDLIDAADAALEENSRRVPAITSLGPNTNFPPLTADAMLARELDAFERGQQQFEPASGNPFAAVPFTDGDAEMAQKLAASEEEQQQFDPANAFEDYAVLFPDNAQLAQALADQIRQQPSGNPQQPVASSGNPGAHGSVKPAVPARFPNPASGIELVHANNRRDSDEESGNDEKTGLLSPRFHTPSPIYPIDSGSRLGAIVDALKNAQENYANWYGSSASNGDYRGRHGFFSKTFRHTQRGQRNALNLKNECEVIATTQGMTTDEKITAISAKINSFLVEPARKYNKHSFSNVALSFLRVIDGSDWMHINPRHSGRFSKTATQAILEPVLRQNAAGNQNDNAL